MTLRKLRPSLVAPALLLILTGALPWTASGQGQEAPALEGVHALTDRDTDGPLFRPRDLTVRGDTLWIVDTGNHRLVRVPPEGGATSVGREGEGPGEFRVPLQVDFTLSGHVFVWDRGLARITVFDPDGGVVETRRFGLRMPGLQADGVLPLDSSGWAVVLNTSLSAMNRLESEEARAALVRAEGEDRIADTLATMPRFGNEAMTLPLPGRPRGFRYTVTGAFSDAPPFPGWTPACGGLLALSTGDRAFRIELFGLDGAPRGVVERAWRGEPVTDDQWSAYLTRKGEELKEVLEDRLEPPERHAAIQGMILTDDGRVLVRRTWRGVRTGRARWAVFPLVPGPSDGMDLGEPTPVSLPARFLAKDAANGLIWGLETGPAGVQRVRAYRLPPAGQGVCGGGSDASRLEARPGLF